MFRSFFPRHKNEALKELDLIKKLECAVIYFESPLRILKTLNFINDRYGSCEITFVVKPLCHRKESKISNEEILTLSNQLIGAGLNISKISKIISTFFNLSKREVYQLLIKNKQ